MRIKSQYLLNPFFIACLLVLMMNDFWWKETFHNWLTGKLSDLSGLAMVTMLVFALGGWKAKRPACLAVSILFIFWKSGWSQPLIDAWNAEGIMEIGRAVDYTDIPCLLVLLPVYYYEPRAVQGAYSITRRIAVACLAGISLFSIVATSKRKLAVGNNLYVNTRMKLNTTHGAFIDKLRKDHIEVEYDTGYMSLDSMFTYKVHNFILDSDTFLNLDLYVYKDTSKIMIYVPHVELTPARLAAIKKGEGGYPKAIEDYRNKLQVFFRKYE